MPDEGAATALSADWSKGPPVANRLAGGAIDGAADDGRGGIRAGDACRRYPHITRAGQPPAAATCACPRNRASRNPERAQPPACNATLALTRHQHRHRADGAPGRLGFGPGGGRAAATTMRQRMPPIPSDVTPAAIGHPSADQGSLLEATRRSSTVVSRRPTRPMSWNSGRHE